MTRIKKGLDIPLGGSPKQSISKNISTKTVAIVGSDYIGMKPTMLVKEGDSVKLGQPVFECKKNVGVVYTAPAAGKVVAINRGARRVFQSLVIEVTGDEQVTFNSFNENAKDSSEGVKSLLVESGLWTSLRQRPFSKVADFDGKPHAIFVTATDTNPNALDPSVVIDMHTEDFHLGIEVLSQLTEGKTHVVKRKGSSVTAPTGEGIELNEFSGVHPAGNVGTHIHFLSPVNANKYVWYVGYQDVIAIGKLFSTGKLWSERVVALGGPQVTNPSLVRTRLGANISELLAGNLEEGENRVISGPVLNGYCASDAFDFLGRYHNQVSVVKEGKHREFMGWHDPGFNKFSISRTFLSNLMPKKLFNLTTNMNGSLRAMVPTGSFEAIMPMDILPTQLLRALVVKDTDQAQLLGCLELDEEDLALCTFVSTGKTDFGPILRENLTIIEKEG